MEFPDLGSHPTVRTLVVGLGHPDRGDDAAGLQVAEELTARDLPFTAVRLSTTGLLGRVDEISIGEQLVVVDAVLTGAAPGTVLVLDRAQIRSAGATFSSHGLDLAAEFALLEALGRLPATAWVIGIEIGDVTVGAPLTSAVEAAVPRAMLRAIELASSEVDHVPR